MKCQTSYGNLPEQNFHRGIKASNKIDELWSGYPTASLIIQDLQYDVIMQTFETSVITESRFIYSSSICSLKYFPTLPT